MFKRISLYGDSSLMGDVCYCRIRLSQCAGYLACLGHSNGRVVCRTLLDFWCVQDMVMCGLVRTMCLSFPGVFRTWQWLYLIVRTLYKQDTGVFGHNYGLYYTDLVVQDNKAGLILVC